MTIEDQLVSTNIIMQYKTSNCDTHKSFIKCRNSHDGKVYLASFGGMFLQMFNIILSCFNKSNNTNNIGQFSEIN